MDAKASYPSADAPNQAPAESKTNDNHGAPNNTISKVYKQSKPGVDSVRNPALPSHQPLPIRETPQSHKKPAKASSHKRNHSDDSTSSMLVSPSDREDNPNRERASNPEPRRLREAKEVTIGVGSVFQEKTSS